MESWLILISLAGCFAILGGLVGMFHGYELGCSDTRQWLIDRERERRALP